MEKKKLVKKIFMEQKYEDIEKYTTGKKKRPN